ncbi:MAG: YfbU family protein [Chloroflexota bacterium]
MLKLSKVERWLLANQYRILEIIDADSSEEYQISREILENGYEGEYEGISREIYEGEDILNEKECDDVTYILAMFSALKNSYTSLQDKTGIDEFSVTFQGFGGNDETKYLSYTRFICDKLDRFTGLNRGDNFNSHFPMLSAYLPMLAKWRARKERYDLTKEDIVYITSRES